MPKKKTKPSAARKKPKKEAASSSASGKPICFVVMPFGDYFDDCYERVFKLGIKDAGLEPHRADDLFRAGAITTDIWAYTQRAKLVVADLSDRNPNVFYELGLAHGISKPAILVVDSIESVPFDLRSLRIIEYDKNDPSWGDKLRQAITKAVRDTVAAPLTSVLPAFALTGQKSTTKRPKFSHRDRELLELRQEMEVLRREIRGGRLRGRDSIEAEDAETLVREYLARGMPLVAIVSRLVPLGVPADWIAKQAARIQGKEHLAAELPIQNEALLQAAALMGAERRPKGGTSDPRGA